MKFVDWLKQKLNTFVSPQSPAHATRRNRRRDYHQRKRWHMREAEPENDQTSEMASESNDDKRDEQIEKPDVVIDAEPIDSAPTEPAPALNSTVTFFYVDENGQPIKEPDILNGYSGQRVSIQLPSFKKYYLVSIENFSSYFEDFDQQVTLKYALKEGLPVLIYYLDIDTGKVLHRVKIISDKLGKAYDIHAEAINDYRVINNTGQTYGYFDERTHGVIFYYRRVDWKTVQRVEYYVRLKAAHKVFDEPNGKALKTGLPENVITQIFARIDTTDNQSWLNIGGFEWIKNAELEPSDPPTNHLIPPITKTSRNPVMLFGTIDFVPGRSVEVFDEPYGNSIGALENGSRVSIKARIVDDQGLIWYELADQSIIFNEYVRVDE